MAPARAPRRPLRRLRGPGRGARPQHGAAGRRLRHPLLGHPGWLPLPSRSRARRLRASPRRPAGRGPRGPHPSRAGRACAGRGSGREPHLSPDRPPRLRLVLRGIGRGRDGPRLGLAHPGGEPRPRAGDRAAPAGAPARGLRGSGARGGTIRPDPVQPSLPRLGPRGRGSRPREVAEAGPRRLGDDAELRRPGRGAVVPGRRAGLHPPHGRGERRDSPGRWDGSRRSCRAPRRFPPCSGRCGRRARGSSAPCPWRRARSGAASWPGRSAPARIGP